MNTFCNEGARISKDRSMRSGPCNGFFRCLLFAMILLLTGCGMISHETISIPAVTAIPRPKTDVIIRGGNGDAGIAQLLDVKSEKIEYIDIRTGKIVFSTPQRQYLYLPQYLEVYRGFVGIRYCSPDQILYDIIRIDRHNGRYNIQVSRATLPTPPVMAEMRRTGVKGMWACVRGIRYDPEGSVWELSWHRHSIPLGWRSFLLRKGKFVAEFDVTTPVWQCAAASNRTLYGIATAPRNGVSNVHPGGQILVRLSDGRVIRDMPALGAPAAGLGHERYAYVADVSGSKSKIRMVKYDGGDEREITVPAIIDFGCIFLAHDTKLILSGNKSIWSYNIPTRRLVCLARLEGGYWQQAVCFDSQGKMYLMKNNNGSIALLDLQVTRGFRWFYPMP